MSENTVIEKPHIPMYQKDGRINVSAIQAIFAQAEISVSYDKSKQLRKSLELLPGNQFNKDEMIHMTKDQTNVPPGWYPRPDLHEHINYHANEVWKSLGGKNKVSGVKHVRDTLKDFFEGSTETMKLMDDVKDTKAEIYLMLYALQDPEPLTEKAFSENVGVVDILPMIPHILRIRMKRNIDSR